MYAKFAEAAPVGICSLDDAHNVNWANKAFMEVMGHADLMKSFFSTIHPDDAAAVQDRLKIGVHEDDRPVTFECRLTRPASRAAVTPSEPYPENYPAWILMSIHAQDDGEIACWVIDITSHRIAEEFLRRRMDEALEMKQQKERFIDMISHEVRNPLSAMMHCTDEILDDVRERADDQSVSISQSAATISYCAQHIRNIVDDVLTLSKLDSRLVDVNPVPAKPQEVVSRALKIFESELRASDIEIAQQIHSSIETLEIDWMLIDISRMLQVLINLMTNAIKVLKGRPTRKIVVKLSASKKLPAQALENVRFVPSRLSQITPSLGDETIYLSTSVEDTGPGLSDSELASLFERFAQVNPKTQSKYGGVGLGLFISRDLTELQGGQLGIATEQGTGSTFVFSIASKRVEPPKSLSRVSSSIDFGARLSRASSLDFPIRQDTPVSPAFPTGALSPLRGQGITRSSPPERPPRSTRKILIVEDNIVNQKVLANQLSKRGYDVSVALHGGEALEKLQMISEFVSPTVSFDVVLMDLEMPVMDGLTCIKAIRTFEAEHDIKRTPVIAVTANARSEHGEAALKAGMDGITTKPYRIQDLLQQIEQAVKQEA